MTTAIIGVVLLGATMFAAYKWRPWRGTIATGGLLAFTGFLAINGLNAIFALIALMAILGLIVYPWFKQEVKKANDHLVVGSAACVAALLVVTFIGFSMSAMNPQQTTVAQADVVTAVVDGQIKEYTPLSSSTPLKQELSEASNVTYYAYQAEAGTNNFGPAITLTSAEDGLARLAHKLGSDPLFTATIVAFDKDGTRLDTNQVMSRAHRYIASPQDLHKDAQAFADNIVGADLINMGAVEYDSLGMIPGENPNEMPQLTKFSTQPAMNQVLVVTMKSGRELFLRVACDLQPSAPHFENVTPPAQPEKPPVETPETYVPPTPPVQETTTPSVPPTTTTETTPPTETTTTTVPPTTTTTTVPPTTTTTVPPTTTTTVPPTTTTVVPTKNPEEDPCQTGNDPHGCQTDNGDPITADPEPSEPAVPESDAPATYTTPPAPEPTTVPREEPIPTVNEGAPSDNPVTGEPDPGVCEVCGPAEGAGSNTDTDQHQSQQPVVAPDNGGDNNGGGTDGTGNGDTGASAPAIDEAVAPAEVQQPAAPPAAEASAPEGETFTPNVVASTPVENMAFTSSTDEKTGLLIALAVLAVLFAASVFLPGRKSSK